MSSPPPYDLTAPPPSLQSIDQQPYPLSYHKPEGSNSVVDLGQPSLSTNYPLTPRLVSREVQNVARDGMGRPPTKVQSARGSFTAPATRRKSSICRPSPLHDGFAKQSKTLPAQKKDRAVLQKLQRLSPFSRTAHVPSALTAMLAASEAKPARKPSPTAEILEWRKTFRRKRRASELFNMNFNWNAAPKRNPEDRTPPESPRGSIYMELVPSLPPLSLDVPIPHSPEIKLRTPTSPSRGSYPRSVPIPIQEPSKRQRMDSTGTDAILESPGLIESARQINGFDLRDPAPSSDTLWIYRGRLQQMPPDPHPGELVDFSTPRQAKRLNPIQLRHDSQSLPDCFLDASESLAGVASSVFARTEKVEKKSNEQSPHRSRERSLKKHSHRVSSSSSSMPKSAKKELRSSERAEQTTNLAPDEQLESSLFQELLDKKPHEDSDGKVLSPVPGHHYSTSTASSAQIISPTSSTSPSTSTSTSPGRQSSIEAALEFMRADQAARLKKEQMKKRCKENPVFKDEHSNGFLGDDPI